MWQTLAHFVDVVFGGDTPIQPLTLGQVATRGILMYLAGVIIVRLGKSRSISRWSALDVILGFVLGSLLSRGITGSAAMSSTIVAASVLVAIHWLFTLLAFYSHRFGTLIKGNIYPLIEDGRLNWKNMRHSHISLHDLVEQLRLHANLEDPQKVKVAYKERSGEVGVVKKEPEPRVIEVGVQQGVQTLRIEIMA